MEEIHITEKRLSTMLNITPRYVRDLFSNHRIRSGVYDLLKCIDTYVRETSGRTEELELNKIKAETAKFKLDVMKKEYIAVDEIEILLGELTNKVKSKVRAIPSKGARLIEGETDRLKIEEILKTFTDEVLTGLAEYNEVEWDVEYEIE